MAAKVALFEAGTQIECQQQVNDFLQTLPLSQVIDVQHGEYFVPVWLKDGGKGYWCMVIYQEA